MGWNIEVDNESLSPREEMVQDLISDQPSSALSQRWSGEIQKSLRMIQHVKSL
ncbi:hypothetical protein BCE02nite_35310 [Brevibacillus centrosporus]|nr:hypothetical protein BCE02nite_35310 [Brevibacillus centrosporus]